MRVTRAEGTVELAVEDDGPGIAAEQREAVFRPYVRASEKAGGAEGEGGEGLGFGLAIARQLVLGMGGELRVEDSESGRGARLVIRLSGIPDASLPKRRSASA